MEWLALHFEMIVLIKKAINNVWFIIFLVSTNYFLLSWPTKSFAVYSIEQRYIEIYRLIFTHDLI